MIDHDMIEFMRKVRDTIPNLYIRRKCPEAPCDWDFFEPHLWSLITHLNDDHKWSREQVADWLDTLDIDLTFPLPSK